MRAMMHGPEVLFPGAAAFIRACAAEVPVAICSGALRHEIEAVVAGAGLGDAVRLIVASGDTPAISACGACDDHAYCTDHARHTVMTINSKMRRPMLLSRSATLPSRSQPSTTASCQCWPAARRNRTRSPGCSARPLRWDVSATGQAPSVTLAWRMARGMLTAPG